MIDFRALETFVWVATLKSFRGAAVKLHTTQPAVSQRVAQLERDLGRKLFERGGREARLTDPGRRLLDHAERLLRARADMIREIADPASLTGVLRLGVAETIVHTWLSRFIERMARAYPGLAIEIDVDISPNLRERLMDQAVDLAFLLGPLSVPAARNLPLRSYPLAFVASPDLDLGPAPVSAAALSRQPILTFARNTQPYAAIRELFAKNSGPPARVHASAALSTIVRMAIDGLGVAAIPPAIVSRELAEGSLRVIETAARLPNLSFVAAWRASPDAEMAAVVAALAAEIAAE